MTNPLAEETRSPQLGGGKAWANWFIAVAMVVWVFNIQTSWAILQGYIDASLPEISLTQLSLIAAVYTWTFAISQLFSGALLDRLGARRVFLPAMLFVTAGTVIYATAQNFAMLLVSQAVIAVGASVGFVGAGFVGGAWFGMAKFGFMFGLVQVAASLSSGVGQTAFNFALSALTWRQLIGGLAAFGVILLGAALVLFRDPQPVRVDEFSVTAFAGGIVSNIMECLKRPQVLLLGVTGALFFGIQIALGVVWMPHLARAHGVSDTQANLAAAAIWFGMALGASFVNKWSDVVRYRTRPYFISGVLKTAALAGMIWLPLNGATAIGLAFIFGVFSAAQMLAFTIAGDIVPARLIGTASSLINGLMFVTSGLLISLPGTMLAGTAETLADYQKPMAVFFVLSALGVIIGLWVRESHPMRRKLTPMQQPQ